VVLTPNPNSLPSNLLDDYAGISPLSRLNYAPRLPEPNAKSIAPAEIIRPNAMMNAAFAKFFSQLWSVPPVFSPYIAAGYEDDANKLLQILDEIPTEPENDREVVDAWAKYTKLDKWYYTETR